MPSQITKKYGAGQELSTPSQLKDYLNSLDLIATDSTVVIKVVGSIAYPDSGKPVTCDDTHRVLFTADDGAGPNDLHRTTFNYPATGSELVFPRFGGGYGIYFGPGLDFENLRLRATGDAATSQSLVLENHRAGLTFDNAFRRCRIRDESLNPGRTFSFGISGNIAEFTDNFVEVNGVADKAFADGFAGRTIRRCTVAGTGPAAGTARFLNTGGNTLENTVGIGVGRVAATGSTLTNCFANVAQMTGSMTIGLTVNTATGALVVNEATDFRPTAAGPLINTGTVSAQGTKDILGNNRGPSPDVGAWELSPFAPSPTGAITSIVVSGQTVTISGTTANTPTSGTGSLTLSTTPYNSGVPQSGVAVTLGTNSFTVTFSNVKVGRYAPIIMLSNDGGGEAATNSLGNVEVLGASGAVTSQVLDGQQLTISGITTGNPTAVPILVPAAATNPNGAADASVNATLGAGTFTATVALGAGNYDPPVVRFTTAAGTSLPVAGTSAVSVIGIIGNPEAPEPDNPPPASTVSSVTITPAVATGSTTFAATVNGTNSPSQAVTWERSPALGSIASNGAFAAPAQTNVVQVITITARSMQDSTKTGTATVTIAALTAPQVATVSSVTVSPSSGALAGGATRQHAATVNGTNSPSQAVTWGASAGSISASGLFTAPAATSVQQVVTVTATSVLDPTKSGTAVATIPAAVVIPPDPEPEPEPEPEPDPSVPDERNYTWLQAEALDWLHRPDLAPKVPKFITMAEARINRVVQARGMEVESTLAFAAGIGAVRLPAGFDTPVAAWVLEGTGRRDLVAVVPEAMPGTTQRGEPSQWAISGTYLALDCPVCETKQVTLRYRGLLRLSDASPNNSVLSKYPDVYLYGALMEAALFLRDPDSLQTWSPLFDQAMKELNRNESRARGVAPLRTELAGMFGRR